MQKEKTSKLPLKDRWPNTTSFSLFQSSCLNGCSWKFRGCFFVNFQKSFISVRLLLRFNLPFSKVFLSAEVAALFCKKIALKNFTIFTGNQLCWNLFLIKLQAFRSPGLQLYQNKSPTQVFFCEYCENIHFEKDLRMDASASKWVIYVSALNVVCFTMWRNFFFNFQLFLLYRNLLLINKIHYPAGPRHFQDILNLFWNCLVLIRRHL